MIRIVLIAILSVVLTNSASATWGGWDRDWDFDWDNNYNWDRGNSWDEDKDWGWSKGWKKDLEKKEKKGKKWNWDKEWKKGWKKDSKKKGWKKGKKWNWKGIEDWCDFEDTTWDPGKKFKAFCEDHHRGKNTDWSWDKDWNWDKFCKYKRKKRKKRNDDCPPPTTGIPTPGAGLAGLAMLGLIAARRRRD